jgi:hypothetical protein
MPNFLVPGRRDVVPLSDAAVEALLAGTELPAEAAPLLQPIAEVLGAMRAGPASDELAGEGMAMAEFRRAAAAPLAGAPACAPAAGAPTAAPAVGAPAAELTAGLSAAGAPATGHRAHRRRRPMLGSLLGARAAIAGAVAALVLGGLTTAAFAGVLPASMQRLAHDVIGAPAPARSPGGPAPAIHGHRSGQHAPGGAGAARSAHPACTAYAQTRAHGTAAQQAVAYHNLVKAAGGAGHISGYCGHGLAPSTSRSHAPHPGKKQVPPGKAKPKKTPPGQRRAKHNGQSNNGQHKGQSNGTASAHQHGHSGGQHQGRGKGAHKHKNSARRRVVTSRS